MRRQESGPVDQYLVLTRTAML